MREDDDFWKMLIEEAAKMGPPPEETQVIVHREGKAIEIYLDVSESHYCEWIKGEGADICLFRSQETGKLVGARFPLKFGKVVLIDWEPCSPTGLPNGDTGAKD